MMRPSDWVLVRALINVAGPIAIGLLAMSLYRAMNTNGVRQLACRTRIALLLGVGTPDGAEGPQLRRAVVRARYVVVGILFAIAGQIVASVWALRGSASSVRDFVERGNSVNERARP
jgi:hypothetical protein